MATKILVTGCSGLVGHGICSYLLRNNYQVTGTSRNPIQTQAENFSAVQLNLESAADLARAGGMIKEADVIIHNAALVAGPEKKSDSDFFKVNTQATFELLRMTAELGRKPFIYISTSPSTMVHPESAKDEADAKYNPSNVYHASKIAAEIFCQQYNTEGKISATILRVNAPYGYRGVRHAVVPSFIDAAREGKDITLWGTGQRQQIFTFVEDVGFACKQAIERKRGGIYNITGGEPVTMRALAEMVIETFSSKSKIVYADKPDPQEGRKAYVSISKAARELKYSPKYSVVDGLKKIKEYLDNAEVRGGNFVFPNL